MAEENKKTILFVEDEQRLVDLIAGFLGDAGYEVVKAGDGEECLGVLEKTKPDLILLDLILPKKDGFDVLRKISSDKETKNIPVIILTNLEEKFDIERALSYGARAYLVKANYRPQEIVEKIKEVLNP